MATKNISYSSEMMTNYVHAEIISPQKKFAALQTSDGLSLLFSIGTDDVLWLIRETSGQSAAGWTKTDLSSAMLKNLESGASCRTFEAGQSVQDGSLGLAMVVGTSSGDNLFLCLGNSNQDLSWTEKPNWTLYNYDAPFPAHPKLQIVNVFFCEATGGTQYIIVDVVKNPDGPVKFIERFYIDPTKASGHYWNRHELPVNFEVDRYDSCVGQRPGDGVDGLYTAGHVGDSGQFEFLPLLNFFGDTAPTPSLLALPDKAVPEAIAATRNPDLSTDLFAIRGDGLYYFPSSGAGAQPATKLLARDVLSGTRKLVAMSHEGTITLWGLNANAQVYYLTCPRSRIAEAGAWSVPLPILGSIETISPYVNGVDGGNTIFAAGAGQWWRVIQSPETKLWQSNAITLPPPSSTTKATSFNSYTTTIQVTDEQNLPKADVALSLRASTRCSVFINGVYHVLGTTPVSITSNKLGSITIMESTGTLNGTTFTVSSGSDDAVTIKPMEGPFKKLAKLNTFDKLSTATINEGGGKTHLFVVGSPEEKKVVAEHLGNLGMVYDHLSGAPLAPSPVALAVAAPLNLGDAIVVAAGDLFAWLKTGVDAVINIVYDAAEATWHFTAKIGNEFYRAVLDSVHSVVTAVEWVFQKIRTAIDDIIKYVSVLFEWEDIRRTKEVFHNLIKRYLESQIQGIDEVRNTLDNKLDEAMAKVRDWAELPSLSALGETMVSPVSRSASDPTQNHTAASRHLSHHFENNASKLSVLDEVPAPNVPQGLVDELLAALENEGKVLAHGWDELTNLINDFQTLTLEQVLKKLFGILAEAVLGSVKTVMDALLKILANIARSLLELLDTKIHIPVISDILNAIGVPDISFLDLFCWISALAVTVVYKIASKGKAPFPDDSTTAYLRTAPSFHDLRQSFGQPVLSLAEAPRVAHATSDPGLAAVAGLDRPAAIIPIPPVAQRTVFTVGHAFAAGLGLLAVVADAAEAAVAFGEPNPFSTPSAVLGVLVGAMGGAANFLVPKHPFQDPTCGYVSNVFTGLRVLTKVTCSGPVQERLTPTKGFGWVGDDGRGVGAIVDGIFVIPQAILSCMRFVELAKVAEGEKSRTEAILDETSSVASYIGRIAYAVAVNTKHPMAKGAAIGFLVFGEVCYAGLQTAEAAVS